MQQVLHTFVEPELYPIQILSISPIRRGRRDRTMSDESDWVPLPNDPSLQSKDEKKSKTK